jgi:hypothetical protein
MPNPNIGEDKETFIKRCMGDPEAVKSFPDEKQRYAVCVSKFAKHSAKSAKVHPVVEWVTGFETKVEEIKNSVNGNGQLVTETSNELKTVLGRIQRKMDEKIEEKAAVDERNISQLIELINSKDYKPEIKLDPGIGSLREEMLVLMGQFREDIMKKKTWVHTIERDKNELIKKITSISL